MSHEALPRSVVDVGNGFFNFRASFKIAGLIDVGTQASLVRRKNGKYVAIDACALDEATVRWMDEVTRGGKDLEAMIHVHPFHTLHVQELHARYPKAKLYGTARHASRLDALPWESEHTEDAALHARFADDFEFTVPRGVDFISSDERVHFSSVLVFHGASKTLHVDDTLLYVRLPKLLRGLKRDVTRFHPTLAKALERKPGAAQAFRDWATALSEQARGVDNLCAAHSAALVGSKNRGPSIAERIEHALEKAAPTLRAHEQRYA